jgi:hypothetical protein
VNATRLRNVVLVVRKRDLNAKMVQRFLTEDKWRRKVDSEDQGSRDTCYCFRS